MNFAADRHSGQRRKGNKVPYINHLLEVADIVAHYYESPTLPILQAAVLHDILEDTKTKESELADLFGKEVTGLVVELTERKTMLRKTRRRWWLEQVKELSSDARIVKLADLISNVGSLPGNWPKKRRIDYVNWAEAMLFSLKGVSTSLEHRLAAIITDAQREQKMSDSNPYLQS